MEKHNKVLLNGQQIAGFTVYAAAPIGAVMLWPFEVAPVGWLFIHGEELPRADYPQLFEKFGTRYNKETTDDQHFCLPDWRDRVPQGANGNLGELIAPALPNLKGQVGVCGQAPYSDGVLFATIAGQKAMSGNAYLGADSRFDFDASRTNPIYKDDCDTVQPPAFAINYIIKATEYAENVDPNNIDDSKTTTGNVWTAAKTRAEIDAKHKYSTEEKIIGEWIDGKPIYRKVFTFDTPIQAQGKWGIIKDLENEDTLIGGTWLNITPVSGHTMTGPANVGKIPNNKIGIYIPVFSEGNYIKAVILEYTKTTE